MTSSKMDNSHERYFLLHYQKLLFSEQNVHSSQRASIRRKCFAQMFKASVHLSDNITTCALYEKNMKLYSDIVDNQKGINNYAESIQTILSCSPLECNKWKSSLNAGEYKDNFHCNSFDITDEDIDFLVQARKINKSEDNDVCITNSTASLTHHEMNPPVFRKRKDADIFGVQEPTFSKKSCMKNMENMRSNILSGSKSSNLAIKSNNPILKHPSETTMKSPLWNSKFHFGNSRKPSSSSTVANNTAPSRQNCLVPSHTDPQMETKNQNIQKPSSGFSTARDELIVQNQKKWGSSRNANPGHEYGAQKKSLGSTRRSVMNKFVPPVKTSDEESYGMMSRQDPLKDHDEIEDERLKNIDPRMVELIRNEIMDSGSPVHWDDIAGLQFAKTTIQEIVVWPMLRPEIFTGLRRPPKGILLFGPPGTGKTLIGKCIASQSLSTFFSISASSLTSKWIGDGEKMVRALFAVARCHQPAVIFIDEIDSLLTQRSDTEHESSRRIKTEFLVQLDGATTGEEDRILVVGATNRPQELDEAARRRLVKKLYIPLPDHEARCQIVHRLMSKENNCLTEDQINEIGSLTEGYSGADVKNLCQEASLGPIRSISFMDIQSISPDEVRPIAFEDFVCALKRVRASVSSCDLDLYLKWDKTYGSG